MSYYCSSCELAVIVQEDGNKIKACVCDAPIIADMAATATGESSLEG